MLLPDHLLLGIERKTERSGEGHCRLQSQISVKQKSAGNEVIETSWAKKRRINISRKGYNEKI